jgi:hypothetical protein
MLATLVSDLLTEQRETNRLLRRENAPWLTPDEAATMLGKLPVPSGTHTRVLTYCRHPDRMWLHTFGQTRPYTYLRSEVEELADLVKRGKRVLP